MYCQSQTAVKGLGREFVAISLRCRSWTCPDCAEQRRNELIAEAIDGKPNKFLTLTSRRREEASPIAAARELSRCWRIVRKRLMRRYKWKSLPFLAVFEATKLGWPHLHILLRCDFIDVRLVSQWMEELIGAPVVWLEALEQQTKAARYCSKYVGKDSQKFGTSKRYWRSQDWRVVPKRHKKEKQLPPGDWLRLPCSIASWCRDMSANGFQVTMDGMRFAHALLPEEWRLSDMGSGC